MLNTRGSEITAKEVEHAFRLASGAEERFASLCNAVAWAESHRRANSLPSFTERVKVKDFGIDAEWSVELADDGNDHPLLGPGWNVYQYKMRDLSNTGRDKLISGLVSDLSGGKEKKPALVDLYERTGCRPNRYVFFTNLDLTHPTVKEGEKGQKEKLKDAILEGYEDPEGVRVEIMGAAELAASLNGLPHVRSAYFGGSRFSTAHEELIRHGNVWGLPEQVALVGRDAEVNRIRSFLDDPEPRAMFISGPQDMGKTRIAFEVTSAERPVDSVVALRASELGRDDLEALRSPGNEVVVVVEDPGVAIAEALLEEALGAEGLKLLVTLTTAEGEPVPGYDRSDGRVRHMRLEPLGEEDAKELLKEAGADLAYGVERWVIEGAGGNPGILLAAAEAGPDLERGGAVSLAQQVARSFESRVRRELDDDALQVLEVVSVLSLTGISGDAKMDLIKVVAALGDGPTVNGVLRVIDRLEAAGLVRRRGDYAEVMPPLFANHLAGKALLGRDEAPTVLLSTFGEGARHRLLERLRNIRGEEAARFWEGLFEPDGPLHDFYSTSENLHLLVPAAAAMPERTAELIEESISGLDVETRCKIGGEARRPFVYALQELLARQKTAETALRCLLLFAEAENDSYANNASGVFMESFAPIHPLVAIPLDRRLLFLKRILERGSGLDKQELAVEAASRGLAMRGMVLHQGGGADPLQGRPAETWGEVWNYFENLADVLMEATRSGQTPLAEAAGKVLPRALADFALQAPPEKAVQRMEEIVQWALHHVAPVSVSELVGQLRRVHSNLDRRAKALEANTDDEEASKRAQKLRTYVGKVEELREALEKGNFRTRMERWACARAVGGIELVPDGSGGTIFRYRYELRELGKEAAEDPSKLADELLWWAMSIPEPEKQAIFFRGLGEFDTKRFWQERLERAGGEGGAIAFAAYFGGLAEHDARIAGDRLDELRASGKIAGEAVLRATAEIGDGKAGVERVELVTRQRLVESSVVYAVLCSRWVETLDPNQLERLLKALAGPGLENSITVVVAAGSCWQDHLLESLESPPADVLWRCLETAEPGQFDYGYSFDRLAALLTRRHTNEGFDLMEHLLGHPFRFGAWDLVGYYHQNLFWKAICEADRERAYGLVISVAEEDSSLRPYIEGGFKGVFDQQQDANLLLAIAQENRAKAVLVAHMLSAAMPGFWPIAVQIARTFPPENPDNEMVKFELERGVIEPEDMVHPEGKELAKFLRKRLKEMEELLAEDATPKEVCGWLEGLAERIRSAIKQTLISEAKEEIDRLRSGRLVDPADAKDAADRLFGVRTLLELGWLEQALQVSAQDELLRLLPKLKFPEQDETRLRQNLERGA